MIEIETRFMFGRTQIFTDEQYITSENVVPVLEKAVLVHAKNQSEIEYLWDYYRGKTPILTKEKEIRKEINHKVCVNRAQEIVSFYTGYGFGEPIQYIRRGKDDSLSDEISTLNEYLYLSGKLAADSKMAEWLFVCGLAMRMVLPGSDSDDPLKVYTLDPRYSFVVRYNGLGENVLMGVKFVRKESNIITYSVYTNDMYYEIENGIITKSESHVLGMVPIFEYPANLARLGVFETVLSLLDAINELESNRMDDVVQYVNSFLALLGGSIDEETHKKLEEFKMLCLPEGVDAKYLSSTMNQADIQVQVDSLYDAILTITGIPNRNGGSSTSDTGNAVILRDGWSSLESRMKSVEEFWKEAERPFLKLALKILEDLTDLKIPLKNIDIKFSRRNYDNLQTKSQVLTTLLNNPKVHPELAFFHSGMFVDPESAYLMSKQWWEENEQKAADTDTHTDTDTDEDVEDDRSTLSEV